MQALRQLGGGLVLGLLSLIIVIGGISLALAEGYVPPPPTPTATLPPFTPGEIPLPTLFLPSPTETPSASPVPPTNCPPPPGWILVPILTGDTLESLAARYRTTPEALRAANCLLSPNLLPGYGIYVPPVPTATPIPCGPPPGWAQYIVQPGDNLYRISQSYRVTVSQLQQANCLGYSTAIYVGQRLWVPNVATSTPPASPISIEFDTVTPIPTDTPPPTWTPLPTWTPPPTWTPLPTDTPTQIPPSATPPPTETNTPPATP